MGEWGAGGEWEGGGGRVGGGWGESGRRSGFKFWALDRAESNRVWPSWPSLRLTWKLPQLASVHGAESSKGVLGASMLVWERVGCRSLQSDSNSLPTLGICLQHTFFFTAPVNMNRTTKKPKTSAHSEARQVAKGAPDRGIRMKHSTVDQTTIR